MMTSSIAYDPSRSRDLKPTKTETTGASTSGIHDGYLLQDATVLSNVRPILEQRRSLSTSHASVSVLDLHEARLRSTPPAKVLFSGWISLENKEGALKKWLTSSKPEIVQDYLLSLILNVQKEIKTLSKQRKSALSHFRALVSFCRNKRDPEVSEEKKLRPAQYDAIIAALINTNVQVLLSKSTQKKNPAKPGWRDVGIWHEILLTMEDHVIARSQDAWIAIQQHNDVHSISERPEAIDSLHYQTMVHAYLQLLDKYPEDTFRRTGKYGNDNAIKSQDYSFERLAMLAPHPEEALLEVATQITTLHSIIPAPFILRLMSYIAPTAEEVQTLHRIPKKIPEDMPEDLWEDIDKGVKKFFKTKEYAALPPIVRDTLVLHAAQQLPDSHSVLGMLLKHPNITTRSWLPGNRNITIPINVFPEWKFPTELAIEIGDMEALETLLKNGCNPNHAKNNTTLLHICTERNNTEAADILLKHPDIAANMTAGKAKNTPLMTAVQKAALLKDEADDSEMVNILLQHKKTDPNLTDKKGNTPLHIALKAQKKYLVQALLECERTSLNGAKNQDSTPLIDFHKLFLLIDVKHRIQFLKRNVDNKKIMEAIVKQVKKTEQTEEENSLNNALAALFSDLLKTNDALAIKMIQAQIILEKTVKDNFSDIFKQVFNENIEKNVSRNVAGEAGALYLESFLENKEFAKEQITQLLESETQYIAQVIASIILGSMSDPTLDIFSTQNFTASNNEKTPVETLFETLLITLTEEKRMEDIQKETHHYINPPIEQTHFNRLVVTTKYLIEKFYNPLLASSKGSEIEENGETSITPEVQ